jgi:hypothetical protein
MEERAAKLQRVPRQRHNGHNSQDHNLYGRNMPHEIPSCDLFGTLHRSPLRTDFM